MSINPPSKRTQRAMKEDLKLYCHWHWKYFKLDRKLPLELVDYDMLNFLQYGDPWKVIMSFRGQGKTAKTTASICWDFFRDPEQYILLVSKSEGHAKRSLHAVRSWIKQSPWLTHLMPGSDQRDGSLEFDIAGNYSKDPSLACVGITGDIAGRRANRVIPDDIETRENTITLEMREMLRERATEFSNVVLDGGRIDVLMTIWHEETIAKFLKTAGYTLRTWTARYPQPDEPVFNLSPTLAKRLESGQSKVGDPTCPVRFPDSALLKKEAHGRSNWNMQFQLHLNNNGETQFPLKLRDLIIMNCNPHKAPANVLWGLRGAGGDSNIVEELPMVGFEGDSFHWNIYPQKDLDWHSYNSVIAFIDPHGGAGNKLSDKTAWTIVGELHGNLYVLLVDSYQGPHDTKNLGRIAKDLKRFRVNDCFVETNFGGHMLVQLLKPILKKLFVEPGKEQAYPNGWACSVEGARATGQKEVRIIENLEPVMNQHRLIMDFNVAENTDLTFQMVHITRQRGCLEHEDELDSLAGCVAQFENVMDQDVEEAAKITEEEGEDDFWDEEPEESTLWAEI